MHTYKETAAYKHTRPTYTRTRARTCAHMHAPFSHTHAYAPLHMCTGVQSREASIARAGKGQNQEGVREARGPGGG